ncbi:MAG: DMT family transporter [Rhodobacteraceae bacterium]|nr:DMT family transporter [Paracoccaceae bacterium]
MPAPRPANLAALGMILVYATVIGFTDNFVRVIAADAGLWQFHATRSTLACLIVGLAAGPLALRIRPLNPAAVARRSLIHAVAMVIYFGSLAFLPVAVAAAGLFTAPIFVLIFSRFVYGQRIGPFRILAVATGFAGVLLVLGLGQGALPGPATALPVAAGALYALGNIATRQWCEGESPLTLATGFFVALGLLGLAGMAVLALWRPEVPPGAAGFVLRGFVWPQPPEFWFWTLVQAAGSLAGVGLMIRAYQTGEASRIAVFEYAILPMSAFWTWILWGDGLGALQWLGMALIVLAGAIILLRGARAGAGRSVRGGDAAA